MFWLEVVSHCRGRAGGGGGRGVPTAAAVGEGLVVVTENESVVFVFHVDDQVLGFSSLGFCVELESIWGLLVGGGVESSGGSGCT